ncbi:class III lanthipeptide [Streptomyces sp. NPDC059255]
MVRTEPKEHLMTNVLDLQALELPQEEADALASTQSNHCNDTSSISIFC